MVGFGLSGPCISRLLFMVLKTLCWLLIAYASFVPPSTGLYGLGSVFLVGILAEVGRVYRRLEMVGEGSPGHGSIHLLAASAGEIGFRWDPVWMGWSRPGLPPLSNLAGPVQHFKAAVLDAWRNKVAADLCG